MSVLEYQGAAAATAVIMSHHLRAKKILFVEGVSDGRLLHSIFQDAFIPIAARGMQGVVSALDTIVEHNLNRPNPIEVMGFIDRDYLELRDEKNILKRSDILTTLYRDIEIDLFHTQGLKKFLNEKASAGKWKCENELLASILELLYNLSMLRAYNAAHSKNWDFKVIDIAKYINIYGELDYTKLESSFRQKNHINQQEWNQFNEWASSTPQCPKTISRGHDVASALGQLLRHKIGNRKKEETTADIIEENLRLSIEKKFLEIYQWVKNLLAWANPSPV